MPGYPNIDRDLIERALKNDTEAQHRLGEMYLNGLGVSTNKPEALKWLLKAARKGHARSQYQLLYLYTENGVFQDYRKAFRWALRASRKNYPPAQFILAKFYREGQGTTANLKKSLYWLEQAANGGLELSYLLLAHAYQNGEGVQQDIKNFFAWVKKAAEADIADAQYEMGMFFMQGHGIEMGTPEATRLEATPKGHFLLNHHGLSKCTEKAILWLRRAAEQKHSYAQACLGGLLMSFEDSPEDLEEGFLWLKRAAKSGDAITQEHLGQLYLQGIGGSKPDYEAAARWFKESVDGGYIPAFVALAFLQRFELGTQEVDPIDTVSLLRTAAQKGNADAEFLLGQCYMDGFGVKPNKKEAARWLQHSAQQGHAGGLFEMGNLYFKGIEGPRDDSKGVEMYSVSAFLGHPEAQAHLGLLYHIGHGLKKDVEESFVWYSLAAEQELEEGIEGKKKVSAELSERQIGRLQSRIDSRRIKIWSLREDGFNLEELHSEVRQNLSANP